MKVNTETSIDNIGFLLYMQEQERKDASAEEIKKEHLQEQQK